MPAAAAATEAPGGGGADEGHAVDAGVARDLVAHHRAGPGDEVEHARGQVGVGDAAGQLDGAHRGRRRRGPHHRVAAGERGRHQLGGHRVGPVPRADHPDDAAGAPRQHHPLAGRERVGQLAAEALGILCGHAPVLDQLVDLAEGLGVQRLALVEGEGAGQLLAPGLDDVADGVHLGGALERGEPGPGVGGLACRGDRRPGVVAVPQRDRADRLAGGGARRR